MRIRDILEYKLSDKQKQWAIDQKATIIVTMPPQMFLDLTLSPEQLEQIKSRGKSKEQYQQWIDQGEILVHPFLDIDELSGKVVGHEGRARALAAILAGDDKFEVAVVLRPMGRDMNINNVPASWSGQYNKGYKIDFSSLVKSGIIKVLDDNVQRRYNNLDKANAGISSAIKLKEGYGTPVRRQEIPEKYRDLPIIGRGMTSIVLDKGDGNVIMLTRDRMKEEWLTRDWGLNLGKSLEVITSSHNYKLKDFDIYVIEMPKLVPLSPANKSKLRKELTIFNKIFAANRFKNDYLNTEHQKIDTINQYLKEFPDTELANYLEFLQNYDQKQYHFDAALRNAMQNDKGEIVLVDPIVAADLMAASYS